MALKDRYKIKRIPRKKAMELVVKNHYLHRVAPCSFAFGLFEETPYKTDLFYSEKIVGVVIYGVSSSSTLLKGICGESEKNNVYELTRLWTEDDTQKNAESFFIGNTIKLLDREIIVSFADTGQGHKGTVYQASNFLYCGLSAKFKDPIIKGFEGLHHATYANGLTKKQIIDKFGAENVTYKERSRKHRYIFFNAKRRRKKELLKKLKYDILDYPKDFPTKE